MQKILDLNCEIILIVLIVIFLSCKSNDNRNNISIVQVECQRNNILYSSESCFLPYTKRVAIYNYRGRKIYDDTLLNNTISEINCNLYKLEYYHNIQCDTVLCDYYNIIQSGYYKLFVSKFEDMTQFNEFIHENYKYKKIITDTNDIKETYSLLERTQFDMDSNSAYIICKMMSDSWVKIENKYSNKNITNVKSLKLLSRYEISCIEEIQSVIQSLKEVNLNDSVSFYFCLIRRSDDIPGVLKFRDVFIEFKQTIDKNGYLKFKKKILNPQAIVMPVEYE